ncbi:MAG: preprotein translocase subunit SecE [Bacillota bacterium]|nr:preprotein translocase subunit SecE [Bacillota bacterium]
MSEKVSKDGRTKKYFKGVRTELKKVVWPNKTELLKYSALVLVLSIISALFIYLFDFIIHNLLGFIIG